jgi:hypothetical protein
MIAPCILGVDPGLSGAIAFFFPSAPDRIPNRRACESPIEAIARDAAVTVSIALQFGADLETIRQALTKDHDGQPATLLGAALDALAEAP